MIIKSRDLLLIFSFAYYQKDNEFMDNKKLSLMFSKDKLQAVYVSISPYISFLFYQIKMSLDGFSSTKK